MTPSAAPTNPGLVEAIRSDLAEMAKAKGTPYPSVGGLLDVLTLPGTWATIVWRIAIACHHGGLKPISRLLYFLNIVAFGAELQPGVVVGPAVVIPHPVGIGVASGSTIGARCRLMRGIAMGGNANPKKPGHPTLGDDVWVLDGAKIFGPTTIGDRSIVGASAIVSEDVPSDMFIFGARRSDVMRPLADLGLADHGGSLLAEVVVATDQAERTAEVIDLDAKPAEPILRIMQSAREGLTVHVVVDASSIGSGLGGDETMLRGVVRGLAAVADERDRFVVLASDPDRLPGTVLDHPGFSTRTVPRASGARHFGWVLPRVLRDLGSRPDAVFSVTHAPVRSPIPVALMVQDLSFHHHPEFYPPIARARLRTVVPRQVRSAGAVLTVSDHARADLLASYSLDPDRVFTVPNTIDPPRPMDPAALERGRAWLSDRGVQGPFIVYLGNLHPRKNVARAIRAFTRMITTAPELADHRFVVAGGRWYSGSEEEQAAADAPPGSVHLLGRVSDDEREYLLHDAQALVYVSQFEGFGLPPLEAMARGTAVVAARSTSIPEVCGDAAVLVDPADELAIADGLRRVLVDADLRSRLRTAGYRRVEHYSAHRTGLAAHRALASVCPTKELQR